MPKNPISILSLALLILALTAASAFAAATVPDPGSDAAGWARVLYEAATGGQWKIVAGLVLVGLVYPLRLYGPKVFKSALGGLILSFAVALAGTMGLALAAGAQITISLVFAALSTSATAAGVWEWLKAHVGGVQAAADKATAPKAAS